MNSALTLADGIVARRFDDVKPGPPVALGTIQVTREAAIAFARDYDPQPFHLDDAMAVANPVFGRLSASGWHTVLLMQMLVSDYMQASGLNGLAGGRVEGVRWRKPVFPPMLLYCSLEIVAARPSASRPERGLLTMRTTADDEDGECVVMTEVTGIFAREP